MHHRGKMHPWWSDNMINSINGRELTNMADIVISHRKHHIPAYITGTGNKRAGVILIHEVWGLNKNIRSLADRLAAEDYSSNLLVIDDTGQEMINTSREIEGVTVPSNRTYTLFKPQEKLIIPRMNFSSASVVQISFDGIYGMLKYEFCLPNWAQS